MKKILLTVLMVVVIAFVVHWTGIPFGTYIDKSLDWIFRWTTGFIPKLTELIPKFGEWVKQSVSSLTS